MTDEIEHVFLNARTVACRYGFSPVSKTGHRADHTLFLKRLALRHSNFPNSYQLGGRKVFKLSELEAFERDLRPRASRSEAA